MALGQVQVDGGLFQIAVAQQHLDGAQVGAGLQQVCGEAVAEDLPILLMIRIQQRSAIGFIRSME
jgi:hypothetical protein